MDYDYYKITNSTDLREIGISGQVQTIVPEFSTTEQYESINKLPLKDRVDFSFVPPAFKLEAKARKTDWLNNVFVNSRMITISPNFFNLMKGFSLPNHQVFPASVFYKGVEFNYYLVYFYPPVEEEFVDFERSDFIRAHFGFFKEKLEINSLEDYKIAKDQIQLPYGISFSKMVLKQDVINCDIFRFALLGLGIYISENLKTAIEAAGLTGMQITPIEAIKHFYVR